jgi:hypothetical protein
MSEAASSGITLADFPGLCNSIDPRDLPIGAAEVQTNLLVRLKGQMDVRRGLREVQFESTVG